MEELFEFLIKQLLILSIKELFVYTVEKIKKCVSANTHKRK